MPRGREGGHQQAVVSARECARHRAAGKPSDAVRHQPLTRLCGGEIAADFAPKVDDRGQSRSGGHIIFRRIGPSGRRRCVRPVPGWRRHLEQMLDEKVEPLMVAVGGILVVASGRVVRSRNDEQIKILIVFQELMDHLHR